MKEKKVILTDQKKEDYFYEEAIKKLRTNIQLAGIGTKVILASSCFPNEGKSDIVFQLAVEIGKMGKKVLLLDADMRESSYVGRYLVRQKIYGLSEYLSGQCGIGNVLYTTNYTGVDMIFAGPASPNPSELLEQEIFGELLRIMRERYDYVLVDTPPVGLLTDAAVAAKQCDAAVLVVESGRVSRKVAMKARDQLKMSGCRILGAVMNKVDMQRHSYYAKEGYYYNKKADN